MRLLAVVVGVLLVVMGLTVLFGMDANGMNTATVTVGWGMVLGGIALAALPLVRTSGSMSASRSRTAASPPSGGGAVRVLAVVVGVLIVLSGLT